MLKKPYVAYGKAVSFLRVPIWLHDWATEWHYLWERIQIKLLNFLKRSLNVWWIWFLKYVLYFSQLHAIQELLRILNHEYSHFVFPFCICNNHCLFLSSFLPPSFLPLSSFLPFFLSFFFFLTAVPVAYGSSQARDWIGATAGAYTTARAIMDLSYFCDLCCSLQQCQILNPLSEAK